MSFFVGILLQFLLSSAVPVHAANADLSISASNITFSDDLVSGNHLRIYAEVRNVGESDVDGYVSFFQGATPIGDSQVISVRAGGAPEDVYVDFVVPSGDFNIRAEIRGTDPEDENLNNNIAVTKLFTPVSDDDRDTVQNAQDNCLSSKNTDQLDTDRDGMGDACDEDDDNDGLTDGVEAELGSNPRMRDTDGDGVEDRNDAYPLDASRSAQTPPPIAKLAVAEATPSTEPPPATDTAPMTTPSDTPSTDSTETPIEPPQTPIEIMPAIVREEVRADYPAGVSANAGFRYERQDWNTFAFEPILPEEAGERIQWDFGDGSTSNKRVVEHSYRTSGSFQVHYTRIAPDGTQAEDVSTVTVAFFTLRNIMIRLLIGALCLALLVALTAFVVLSVKARRARNTSMALQSQPVTKPVVSVDEPDQKESEEDASVEEPVTRLAVRDADQASGDEGDAEEGDDRSEDDAQHNSEEETEDASQEEVSDMESTDEVQDEGEEVAARATPGPSEWV